MAFLFQVGKGLGRGVPGRRLPWSAGQRALFAGSPARAALSPGAPAARARHPMAGVALRAAASDTANDTETFEYQAEVNRLLDLIVNSLYSNKDVFLRELVSNASDALDKIRFKSVRDASVLEGKGDLTIEVKADEENKVVTITDTGIGMTKGELLDSLGTIARSGTAKFMEALKQSQESGTEASLIGQFGVGFYSSFLVADKVRVQTKSNDDDKQWLWESSMGSINYTVSEDSGEALGRGTRVTLYLKEDCHEYSDHMKLRDLIKQYSEFIGFPINLWTTKTVSKQVIDEEATAKKAEEQKEKGEEGEVEPVMKTDYDTVWDWAVQNDNKPLWLQSAKDCTKEDYDGFFKATFREFADPLAYNHFNVEGTYEFSGIIFIPGMAPFDMQDQMQSNNVKLYVNKVFISDKFDESFLPRYLNFVKGVVDSKDLPLNVSREILQQSRVSKVMNKQLVKRTLDTLKGLAGKEDPADYDTFWESFGRNLKLGVIEDQDNRKALAELLRFDSSKSGEKLTSLSTYVSNMKEGQKGIYYIAADSKEIAQGSPFVEELLKRDVEILYLVEPIDEVCVSNLGQYQEKDLVDVTKEGLELDEESDEDKKKAEEAQQDLKQLTDWMKEVLGSKVEKVVVSKRMSDSPCILVTSKFGWSANMERIMKSQAMGDNRAMEYMRGQKIMEINPNHQIVANLKQVCANPDDHARSMVALMYETALLTSGFSVESPKDFAGRVYEMIAAASVPAGGAPAEPAEADPVEAAPVEAEVMPDGEEGKDDPWK